MRLLFALACAGLLLAGCLGSKPASPDATPDPTVPPSDQVPPGCDTARPALAHTYGGEPVTYTGPAAYPCLVATVWGTGEPSIGLDGKGTLFLYPSYQAPTEALDTAEQFLGLAMARSQDEGHSFTRQFDDVAGVANWHPLTADPFMYVDPYTDRVFMEDLAIPPFNCANLSFSDDGGDTWTETIGGCLEWDHVGYGSGPAPLKDTRGYPTFIMRCAIEFVATTVASEASGCQKSLDGGMTWELPGDPPYLFDQDGQPYAPGSCNGAVHHVHVDHRGWTWLGRAWCDQKPYLAISRDEGASWTRVKLSEELAAGHDVGVAVDPAGTAYAFWVRASDLLPVLQVSKDDGATWSPPRVVSPKAVTSSGAVSITNGAAGKLSLNYAATIDADGGKAVHGVVADVYGADTEHPTFLTAFLGAPDDPLNPGGCAGGFCDGQQDFLDGTIGPDGTPWGSYCKDDKLAAGRLWHGPTLWDASDANGVYGGWDGITPPA